MDGSLESRVAALEQAQAALAERAVAQAVSLDTSWTLLSGILVFLMQFGFCMLEAGSVTSRSTETIMVKNIVDVALSALVWWAVGYTFAFAPGSGFIGFAVPTGSSGVGTYFTGGMSSSMDWATWFFQFNFAAAASTIVSGAIAERAHILSYLLFSTTCAAFIYPPVAHWEWASSGWASPLNAEAFLGGVIDFAGCGAVHLVGGVASFVGASIIGPRHGRFDPASKKPIPMPGHSTVLVVMGTMILWMSWYGFNAGSTMAMEPESATTAARVVVTTTLSASSGGFTAVFWARFLRTTRSWDAPALCNGVLAGLVSITAGCATVEPWAAVLIGGSGALVCQMTSRLLLRYQVDDPLDATAVHAGCGSWGLITSALFSTGAHTATVYGPQLEPGLFYAGATGKRLGAALVFLIATAAWAGILSLLIFSALQALGLLRAPDCPAPGADIDLDASIVPVNTTAISLETLHLERAAPDNAPHDGGVRAASAAAVMGDVDAPPQQPLAMGRGGFGGFGGHELVELERSFDSRINNGHEASSLSPAESSRPNGRSTSPAPPRWVAGGQSASVDRSHHGDQ